MWLPIPTPKLCTRAPTGFACDGCQWGSTLQSMTLERQRELQPMYAVSSTVAQSEQAYASLVGVLATARPIGFDDADGRDAFGNDE